MNSTCSEWIFRLITASSSDRDGSCAYEQRHFCAFSKPSWRLRRWMTASPRNRSASAHNGHRGSGLECLIALGPFVRISVSVLLDGSGNLSARVVCVRCVRALRLPRNRRRAREDRRWSSGGTTLRRDTPCSRNLAEAHCNEGTLPDGTCGGRIRSRRTGRVRRTSSSKPSSNSSSSVTHGSPRLLRCSARVRRGLGAATSRKWISAFARIQRDSQIAHCGLNLHADAVLVRRAARDAVSPLESNELNISCVVYSMNCPFQFSLRRPLSPVGKW